MEYATHRVHVDCSTGQSYCFDAKYSVDEHQVVWLEQVEDGEIAYGNSINVYKGNVAIDLNGDYYFADLLDISIDEDSQEINIECEDEDCHIFVFAESILSETAEDSDLDDEEEGMDEDEEAVDQDVINSYLENRSKSLSICGVEMKGSSEEFAYQLSQKNFTRRWEEKSINLGGEFLGEDAFIAVAKSQFVHFVMILLPSNTFSRVFSDYNRIVSLYRKKYSSEANFVDVSDDLLKSRDIVKDLYKKKGEISTSFYFDHVPGIPCSYIVVEISVSDLKEGPYVSITYSDGCNRYLCDQADSRLMDSYLDEI